VAGVSAQLHADALAVLSDWSPPDRANAHVRQRTLDLLAGGPVTMTRAHRPGHVTVGAVVVDADLTSVLLCLHGRFHKWVQLGGHCEPDDPTLAAAALREATEESGIDNLTLHPEPIDLHIHPAPCGADGSWHYDVRFVAVAPPGAVERVSDESHALGWFTADALPEPLADATAHLVAPAIAAAASLRPLR
jgi:8-oxo-dGTP pyrophosphatase MutT (NUDIX family)